MPTRSLNVVISGDARPLEAASKQASRSLDQIGGAHKRAGKAADEHIGATGKLRTSFGDLYAHGGEAILAVAGLEGIKKGVESVTEAYKTQEVSNSALKAQMKALGQSYSAHKDAIEEVVKHTSHLSGIAVPELTSTFTVLDRATGNVHKSLGLVGTAADVASAKHISASKAAVLLGKVADGNVTAFNRYGLSIKAGTSSTDALHQIQKKFAGQAKAYGDTAAGAGDKLKSSWEEVRATLGGKVAPAIAGVERGVAKFITGMQDGTGVGGKFANAISKSFDFVKSTIQTVVKAVRGYLNAHKQDIQSVIDVLKRVGAFAKQVWQDTLLPIVKRTVGAIGPIISGLLDVIRGLVRFVSGLLSGDWSKAWSGAKEVVGGAWKVIKTVVKTGIDDLVGLIKGVGPALIKLIVKGLEGLGKSLANGIADGVKAAAKAAPGLIGGALKSIGTTILNGLTGGLGGKIAHLIGDGIGKSVSGAVPSGGAHGNSLMGANPILAPFAGIAAGFGLQTTSGARPGAITVSGNTSYHASGNAIDESGPPGQMLKFFDFLRSRFGGVLRELIYTPGGVGIKDGRPYRYTGAVAAEHYNHVHVAYTGPFGDGPGRKRARTGDGIGFRGLEDLWVRAGGSKRAAPIMAHVAQAESGGHPGARNPSGASGLWQILGQPFPGNVFDPLTNARMAVWKYTHQGLGAWAASRPVWGRYLNDGETYQGSTGSTGGNRASGGGSAPVLLPTGSGTAHGGSAANQASGSGNLYGPPEDNSFPTARYHAPAGRPTLTPEQQAAATFRQRSRMRGNRVRKGNTPDQQAFLQQTQTGTNQADPNQALIDSNTAAAAAAQALADQVAANTAEQKRSNDLATGLQATSGYQATKYLADLLSGQVVRGVVGRNFTPGTGVEVAY